MKLEAIVKSQTEVNTFTKNHTHTHRDKMRKLIFTCCLIIILTAGSAYANDEMEMNCKCAFVFQIQKKLRNSKTEKFLSFTAEELADSGIMKPYCNGFAEELRECWNPCTLRTCEHALDFNLVCPDYCDPEPRCDCRKGYARNERDRCVLFKFCDRD